jgi:hypothetical protein
MPAYATGPGPRTREWIKSAADLALSADAPRTGTAAFSEDAMRAALRFHMSASARVTSVRTARRRDPEHHFAPVIDYCPNIAEHMAYAESARQKFPRKPELPR